MHADPPACLYVFLLFKEVAMEPPLVRVYVAKLVKQFTKTVAIRAT